MAFSSSTIKKGYASLPMPSTSSSLRSKAKILPFGILSLTVSFPPWAATIDLHSARPTPCFFCCPPTSYFPHRTCQISSLCWHPKSLPHCPQFPPVFSPSLFFRRDDNACSLRRIFQSIVHNIQDYLHNQLGIHPGHKKLILQVYPYHMSLRSSLNVGQRLLDHILQKLRLQIQLHISIFNSGDRQQIFHQIVQPDRIIVNAFIQFMLLFTG